MSGYPDRQSSQIKWFDAKNAGRYAVTICTHHHEHVFGEVRMHHMYFNQVGRLVRKLWYSLPERFPGVCLDAFVLMPNHLHGIIVLPSPSLSLKNMPERFQPSMRALMLDQHPELQGYVLPSLGAIIREFKGAATYQIHQSEVAFRWQERYWKRYLFTKEELQRARRYIFENPQNWEKDKLYKT